MTPVSEYREIPLTQGQVALVDASDYEWLNQWRWFANYNRCTKSYYAGRNAPHVADCKRRRVIWMHREILGLPHITDGRNGDHINHVTVDNRRFNLRIATRSQNQHNQKVSVNNKSGFKGVTFWAVKGLWRARIVIDGRHIFLGYYQSASEAAQAYRDAAVKLHGEFAYVYTGV